MKIEIEIDNDLAQLLLTTIEETDELSSLDTLGSDEWEEIIDGKAYFYDHMASRVRDAIADYSMKEAARE